MKRVLIGLLIATGLVVGTTATRAADFRAPANGDNFTLGEKETARDLHVAGENVTVNAPVKGDLLAAGGSVIVTGDVENSLFVAGGTVSSRGQVGHHARLVGGEVTVANTVAGDLFVAGGTVIIADQAVITGDLIVTGGNVTINGAVNGRVWVGGGAVTINNSVGSIKARVDSLRLGDNAVVAGDLVYFSDHQADISSSAKINGLTTFTPTHGRAGVLGLLAATVFASVVGLVGSVLLLLILIRYRRRSIERAVKAAATATATMAGHGALMLFIAPIILVVSAVTLIGLPITFFFGALWLVCLLAGSLLAKLWLGALIVRTATKSDGYPLDWRSAIVGVLASAVIGLVPIVGGLVNFVIFLVALGAIASLVFAREDAAA